MSPPRKLTRQERRALARQPNSRPPYVWIAAVGGVVALAVAGLLALRPAAQATPPEGVMTFEVPTRSHTTGRVDYPQTPPVGGDHAPIWQNCGFYDRPILNETAVHSLEHGAVWITYRPDLPADQVAVLRGIARRQTFILVSPFPDLPAPVVASAWGHQLRLDSANDPRLAQFIRYFRLGPQTPEPGARCTGGVGTPQ